MSRKIAVTHGFEGRQMVTHHDCREFEIADCGALRIHDSDYRLAAVYASGFWSSVTEVPAAKE